MAEDIVQETLVAALQAWWLGACRATLVDGEPARATIIDFGIARRELSAVGPTRTPLTRTGMVLGTVGYMSPEQAIGDESLDARADRL